jgi:hypothetical protein
VKCLSIDVKIVKIIFQLVLVDNLSSTTLLTIEPYEYQKFWTPIRSSDVGCNPAKLRSSGPLSKVLIFAIAKYVFNWYLKITTRASNGPSIEIKHKFMISPMIKRDGHK